MSIIHKLFYLSNELCIFEDKRLRRMGSTKQWTFSPLTLPNVHRFKKFFHWQITWHICNEAAHHNLNAWLYYLVIYDLSLITIYISDCHQFSDIHISQGSVAIYLRRGGIFKHEFVANLPLSRSAEEFWKSVNIWGSNGQEFSVLLFLTHVVIPTDRSSTCDYVSECFASWRQKRAEMTI